jgi:acetyl-CoA carboxylase alpha subunit
VEQGRNYSELEEEVEAKMEEVERNRDKEVADLQQEIDRLNRERRQLLEQREENKELARWAEDQRTAAHRHRSRPVWRRAWTWVFGDPDDALKGEA